MQNLNVQSNYYPEEYDDEEEEKQPQEYNYDLEPINNKKNCEELIKSLHNQEMGDDDLYEMTLSNQIALNLYQSLNKLKKGPDQHLFKHPCQIKVYKKIKVMMIYLIVLQNFLRIKIDLLSLRENQKYKEFIDNEFQKKIKSKNSNDSESNQSIKEEQNIKEKEIIFTLQLVDFYNMLDLLLTENKDNPISISIDKNMSIIGGRAICPDVFDQEIFNVVLQYNLIKNEIFGMKISPPKENNNSEKNNNSKSNFNENENDDSSNIVIHINNEQSKSLSEMNQINEEESDYLEKRFQMDENCAKYVIEGNDLLLLYYLMKGLEPLYSDFSTHSISINMTNEKALFFSLDYKNIKEVNSFEHLSQNIQHMTYLNIKSIKDHFLTPFKYGFSSFYPFSLLSKFITSFYNKDDKRLLVKVSPLGKMILSFSFSDPKSEMKEILNEEENNRDISSDNLNEIKQENDDNRNRIRKMIKDRLTDDENRGNIVEMIFYPHAFALSQS